MAQQPARKAANRKKRRDAEEAAYNQTLSEPLDIEWRTAGQKHAWKTLGNNTITFLMGAAGSGKTFIAMAYAINEVLNKRKSKIVLTRPIVEAGEKLGFLPGTYGEKVNPYMQPLYDTMETLLGKNGPKREFINKAVVLAPLCYMRGRTFNDAVCIFDEAQNATYTQLKLFLSRFGQNTQVVVTGDPEQSDIYFEKNPLIEVAQKLRGVQDIAEIRFANDDVVRHPLVAAILKRL
jgi:phosphate starvation-inducible PhoH-like protein